MIRRALAALLLWPVLTAGSCATTSEPEIRTVEVKVPVMVPCPDRRGPRPQYPDTADVLRRRPGETPEAHAARATDVVLAGRELRIGRELENNAQIEGCAGAFSPE
jgi:hypothetical protein